MNLPSQASTLAFRFRQAADRLDAEYIRNADPRAIQGGDRCEDAARLRELASDLDTIADEITGMVE